MIRCVTMKMIDLLKDPVFRKYYLRNPKFPYSLANENPWVIWIHRNSKKTNRLVWANVRVPTFKDAVAYVKPRMSDWDDFSISSRVIGFDPPSSVRNTFELYDWCIMCRRPSEFRPFERHHALNPAIHKFFSHWPVCVFCGTREDPEVSRTRG